MDQMRKSHGCPYFSYLGYTFNYFREYGITDYEEPVDIALDEWIILKAVIEDERAEFYINGGEQSILVVNDMKHGRGGAWFCGNLCGHRNSGVHF